MSSAICVNLDQSNILSSGNGLNLKLSKICRLAMVKCPDKDYDGSRNYDSLKGSNAITMYFGYFPLIIVATGCPSERRPQKTVSCYGG